MPKTNEIGFQQPVLPPGMKELKQQIVDLLKHMGELYEGDEGKKRTQLGLLLEKKSANRPWLLGMLAALDPGSKVFR